MIRRKKEKGITILEMVISLSISLLILGFTFFIYDNIQKSYTIGDSEARMQEKARLAIMTITKELRQASDIWITKIPEHPNEPFSKDIRFSVPVVNPGNQSLYGYKIIRYWYVKNPETDVWSLRRFVWNKTTNSWVIDPDPTNKNPIQAIHGNEKQLSLAGSTVTSVDEPNQPATINAYNNITRNSTEMLQEAAVIDPGMQSYFEQDTNNPKKINIRLVAASYIVKSESNNWKKQQLRRTFVLESDVVARNM